MGYLVYGFEVKSIQAFIFAGGKLRDCVGASKSLEWLCGSNGCLDQALQTCALDVSFMRRGGGAFVFYVDLNVAGNEAAFQRFHRLWQLCAKALLPDLETVDAINHGDKLPRAHLDLVKKLQENRNRPSISRAASLPFIQTAPRTGAAAYQLAYGEAIDHAQFVKRTFVGEERIELGGETYVWPNTFELEPHSTDDRLFPLRGEDRRIAILHADGNRLGLILQNLKKQAKSKDPVAYAAFYRDFSETLDKITRQAGEQANAYLARRTEVGHTLPGRAILLGGDDLTAIIRADLALGYTEIFLKKFAELAQAPENKKFLGGKNVAPLTACAGLVFVNAAHPFAKALGLAESLCQHAKKAAKAGVPATAPVPSCLSFHQVTTSDYDSYPHILETELRDQNGRLLTCNPYYLDKAPRLSDLHKLVDCLNEDGFARGPLRGLLDMLYHDDRLANKTYDRWRKQVMARTDISLDIFEKPLQALLELPQEGSADLFNAERTPVHDALVLKSLDTDFTYREQTCAEEGATE